MTTNELIFLTAYFCILGLLCLYGAHRFLIAWLYLKNRKVRPSQFPDRLARITVQLPLFNERYVVERLIEHVCKLEYPREYLEIQVLDDSTDDTVEIARAAVESWREKVSTLFISIGQTHGFKAGALEVGTKVAKGEFVAVFDADFVPRRDFLKRTMGYFCEPNIGMVQARWGHINRNYSLLTQLQGILLDGHFMIEHTARHRSGRFFNFNGTAGIWRKSCLLSAGGWHHDTLTEDLDLSKCAQLGVEICLPQ